MTRQQHDDTEAFWAAEEDRLQRTAYDEPQFRACMSCPWPHQCEARGGCEAD